MPDWRVDVGAPLVAFLRRKGVQQWRIPVIVKFGGVKVLRNGQAIALDDKTRVKPYDLVRLLDPLPPAVTSAFQRAVNTDSRDYAFVPGRKDFDVTMGKAMERRPDTIRFQQSFTDDLHGFVRALGQSALITNPIEDLIVASHANDEGDLFIRIGSISGRSITYEDLEAAVKSKTLEVDREVLQPRPTGGKGAPIPALFIIRGCRIGRQEVYLKKLKEALGGHMPVAAPKHFHVATPIRKPPGFIEYMAYSFALSAPKRLRNKAAVVAAMIAFRDPVSKLAFTRIDRKPVPAKAWDTWVPKDPNREGDQRVFTSALSPVDKKPVKVPRYFRHRVRKLFKNDSQVAIPKRSTKAADRKQAVKDDLIKRDFFKASTPFPVYTRFGYASIDQFMDGWTWTFEPRGRAAKVRYNAARYEYAVIQPITEVATGELILNFFPQKRGTPVVKLSEGDTRMFALV
jgi:hypothetical protein